MSFPARVASLLRNLFRRRRVEAQLDDEVRAYLELATDEKIAAGMDPEAARRAARLELGGVEQVKEEVRSSRAGAWLDDLGRDVRHALSMLRRAPGFTVVAVVTLALGIGANTAIFSVVHGVLLRPAPVEDLDGLVMVWETDRASGTVREPASLPDFLDLRDRSQKVRPMAAMMGTELNAAVAGGEPRRIAGLLVSHELFSLLGLKPVLGRPFSEVEARPAGPNVVVISEGFWERQLMRDPEIVGKSLELDEVPHQIVGVMPDRADFGVLQVLSAAAYSRSFADRDARTEVDVWTPLRPDVESLPRSTHPLFVLGRLAPGASVTVAGEELAAIAADLERTYPENEARGVHVERLGDVVFGPVRPALFLLLGTVALVLLIACVNVANLLLARGAARAREVAIRSALGAGAGRLARQFLVEGLVLTLGSAVVGVGLALFGVEALLALAPGSLRALSTVSLQPAVLGFTLGVSLIVGLALGLIPVLQARRVNLQSALGGGQATAGPARTRLRGALVIVELALAVILVTGAGLLVRSFWSISDVDPGFRPEGVLKAEFQLPPSRYPANFERWPDFAEMHGFHQRLLTRMAALPGVRAVALAGNHPMDAGFTNSFTVEGREAEARGWPEITVRRVTPGYLATVGLPLRRGRGIEAADATAAEPVLLLNETAARQFFAGREPLEARIGLWGQSRRIVGIVADEKVHGLTEAAPPAVYLPLAQAPSANGAGVLLLRGGGDPAALAPLVRHAFSDIDPRLALFGVEPLEATMARSVAQRRFVMWLLEGFALLALVLAAVGIHGVLAYGVAQRSREIGIRMALGAPPRLVSRQIVAQGLGLAVVGVALGIAGALALARLLGSLLYGIAPVDALTFVSVPLFMLAVSLAATYLPARQATRVDPLQALKAE